VVCENENKNSIEITGLKSGIYVAKIHTNSGVFDRKIIVK